MKKLLLVLAVCIAGVIPSSASALDGFPAFPMAFWGTVTINGGAAPVGTVVRAYYGTTLAGEVTVQQEGVYGYTDATKAKLTLTSGTGTISFKVQTPGFNGGAETGGDTAPTHSGFVEGETVQKNLAFGIAVAPQTSNSGNSSPTPTSGGGGGGGGGSGIFYNYSILINNGAAETNSRAVTLTVSSAATANQMQISETPDFSGSPWISFQNTFPWTLPFGNGVKTVYVRYGGSGSIVASAQDSITLVETVTPPSGQSGQVLGAAVFNFTRNLQRGISGNDVSELQKILIAKGHLVVSAPTGFFGPATEAAVKAFQKANGLETVGNVGPKTRSLLNGSTASTQPDSTKQALIQKLTALVQQLLVQIAAIQAQDASRTH